MHRIDAVQPDRRGGDAKRKAAAAGCDAAKQRTEPEDGEGFNREACDHPISQR